MPRRFFRRISAEFPREDKYPWYLKPFQVLLRHPTFFAVSRRSVAGAVWLGLFIALLPIPAQTIVAPLAAILFRVNLPIAFAAVWITNPVTWVPVYFFEYRLGSLILDLPPQPFDIELSWRWVLDDLLSVFNYLFTLAGINTDFIQALPTAFMKPLSGSGARAMMLETMNTFGVDSFAATLSAIMQGSTETTFYVLAVYFGSVGIKRVRHALASALLADLAGITTAILAGYWFFH